MPLGVWRQVVWLVALAGLGCAARSEWRDSRPGQGALYFLGPQEIATVVARNAEDLLQRLRPQLLLPRPGHGKGAPTLATPAVYLNGQREGGIEVLHLVPAHIIREVVYLRPVDADRLLVGAHPAGAIVIRTHSHRPR